MQLRSSVDCRKEKELESGLRANFHGAVEPGDRELL